MHIKKIVDYELITLPEIKSHQDIDVMREKIAEHFKNKHIGASVMIPKNDLSPLVNMVIFEYMRKQVAEIITPLEDGSYLQLLSHNSKEDYSWPEEVRIYREMNYSIKELPTSKRPEIKVDLSLLPAVNAAELMDTILPIKMKLAFTERVVFIGQCDSVSALVVYALWLPFAASVYVSIGGSEIKIR